MRFATKDTLQKLITIQTAPLSQLMRTVPGKDHTKTFLESLKTSAAVAMSHILRLKPQLFSDMLERIPLSSFCQALIDGSTRVQQAYITILNYAIQNEQLFPGLSLTLLNERNFLPSLVQLHEHNSIVIRGKCLLTFLLLFKSNFRWISVVQTKVKFFNILERALKDNFKYVQCCLVCLADGITDLVPLMFQTVAESLQQHLSRNQISKPTCEEFEPYIDQSTVEQIRKFGNLFWVDALVDLITNQFVRSKVFSPNFIKAVACLLDNTTLLIAQPDFDTEAAFQFQNNLLLIVESISNNQKLLMQLHEPIVKSLLPILISKVQEDFVEQASVARTASESRFLCLKILTDILLQILSEESIYNPHKNDS